MSLLTALQSGDERLVETICASGASPNELEDGATPLHIAVGLHSKNAKQLAKILLQYGGDPNVENEERLTPVHISVIRGNAKILHLLLRNGGDASKKDEEGKDAWDYAHKYSRASCQKILRDYMDDDMVTGSDEDQDRYVSIFYQDVPMRSERRSEPRSSPGGSELNRGFVRSSLGSDRPSSDSDMISPEQQQLLGSIREEVDSCVRRRPPPPRPPPRRSKSLKSPDEWGCVCMHQHALSPNSLQYPECQGQRVETLSTPPDTKSHRNIFSAIKKTLSPGAKSESKSYKKPSTSSGKPKSRSPLTSLLRSPSKTPKLTRMASCVTPNSVRFQDTVDKHTRFHRSQSVPCDPSATPTGLSERDSRLLAHGRPISIDATSPDNCVVTLSTSPRKRLDMDVTGRQEQFYSPSNYTQTASKPDKDKVLESPFQLKPRRKSSSRNLFKRLLRSSPASPNGNKGSLNIGVGQTMTLSERNSTDSASLLSVETSPRGMMQRSSSAPECSHCNSSSSIGTIKSIDSKEMAAIEAGRKAFDVTSPDNCTVVDVDASRSSPLDKTLCYESPPPKPQRLFLTSDFSVHQPATRDESSSPRDFQRSTRDTASTMRDTESTLRDSGSTTRITHSTTESPTGDVTYIPTPRTRTTLSEAKLWVDINGYSYEPEQDIQRKGAESLAPLKHVEFIDLERDEVGFVPASSVSAKGRTHKSSKKMSPDVSVTGNFAAEIEQEFKERQQRLKNRKPEVRHDGGLNHRWPSGGGRGKFSRQRSVPATVDPQPTSSAQVSLQVPTKDQVLASGQRPSASKPRISSFSAVQTYEDLTELSLPPVELDEFPQPECSSVAPRPSLSKDSGIASTLTSRTKDQRRVSESEESFHTCQSGSAAQQNRAATDRGSRSPPLLPTEVDSLQAKVSRMNLEDFTFMTSDNESDTQDELDPSKCATVLPSSICASDDSIAEYLHTDLDTKVTLTEARWPITCAAMINHSRRSIDWRTFSELSTCSDTSPGAAPVSVPQAILNLSDSRLHKELVDLGDVPGPIIPATRRVYQLRLKKLQDDPKLCTPNKSCGFSRELQQYMGCDVSISVSQINEWEYELRTQFETSSGRKWREGNSKMSFTYLLLDPRTTKNLPARHHLLDSEANGEAFRVFLSSAFYIGKGKKTRPYQHFIDAIRKKNDSEKTKQIVDIWKSGLGVVSLHVFHNILPVEAYTREACMVDAIGLKNLTNIAKCSYYGVASTWSPRKKRLVGSNLLRKAYDIFLIEGERQIRPADIRDESELPSFLV